MMAPAARRSWMAARAAPATPVDSLKDSELEPDASDSDADAVRYVLQASYNSEAPGPAGAARAVRAVGLTRPGAGGAYPGPIRLQLVQSAADPR
jgi:hypothetical protein